ncbi:glycine betaine ABC transporter substrate-binding protein [Devosia sp.]|uniref:glycine betaine ABC transporter substrate-binding protein n=1 Tax=Devosia sp. TaxID=1871048 RepID=UPI0032661FAC
MRLLFRCCLTALLLVSSVQHGFAQASFTVLDQAQDSGGGVVQPDATQPADSVRPDAPPPPCGTQQLTIASMGWPSAAVLAEIHARLLRIHFACDTQVIPGDLTATTSSMGSSGQPAVAPEMWVGRVADVWNPAVQAQMVRPATNTYASQVFEGWFMPDYLAATNPGLANAAGLKAALPGVAGGGKVRFVTCPVDWACSVINRNLIKALGLEGLVDIVVPANRFEMDTLIGEAVSKQQPVLFYYWQPNAILNQFSFKPIDLGAYDAEALKCLAQISCPSPKPSSFAPETVVIALADRVFTETPMIAGYFQRASLPLKEMDALLAQLNEAGATPQSVADRFVAERQDIWKSWVGTGPP